MAQTTQSPGMAVRNGAQKLEQKLGAQTAIIEPQHDSRCALNAAGTGEALETTHSVVAQIMPEDASEFERAVNANEDLGLEIDTHDDSGRGKRKQYVLKPQ